MNAEKVIKLSSAGRIIGSLGFLLTDLFPHPIWRRKTGSLMSMKKLMQFCFQVLNGKVLDPHLPRVDMLVLEG